MRHIFRLIGSGVLALGLLGLTPALATAEEPEAFSQTNCEHLSDAVYRLYQAAFGRSPDSEGFTYWLDRYSSAEFPLRSQAGYFIKSDEFALLYGDSPTDEEFVDNLYLNVLDRPGEEGGRTYWLDQLGDGLSRTMLLLAFSESPENVTRTSTAPPLLGDFNAGLTDPWDCQQPSCTIVPAGQDKGGERAELSLISTRSTQQLDLSFEVTFADSEATQVMESDLGPAAVGERMGDLVPTTGAISCQVVGTTYDPRPIPALPGTCQVLPATGGGDYDIGLSFVATDVGDVMVTIAVRDADGNRLATGYHQFGSVQVGTKIDDRTTTYPVAGRPAASCAIVKYDYTTNA